MQVLRSTIFRLLHVLFCTYQFLSLVAQPKPFTVYTREDGLLTNQIFDFVRDQEGFVWIATGDGLNIYNGTNFQALLPEKDEISSAPVWGLFEHHPGEMWVSTSKGIDVFKSRKKAFTFHRDTTATFLKLKNGEILGVDSYGIFVVNNYACQLMFSYPYQLGRLIEAGNCIIVKPVDFDSLLIFNKQLRLIKKIRFAGGLIKDAYDQLWYLIDGKARPADLNALENGQTRFLPIPYNLRKYNQGLTDFYYDKAGYYWLSKPSKGIILIDKEGTARQYTMNDGLPTNELHAFKEDREGNTWIFSNALIRFGFKNVHLYTSLNGMRSTACWSVAEHKSSGSIWLLQSDGISCFYKGRFYFFGFPDGKKGSWGKIHIYNDSLIISNTRINGYYKIVIDKSPKLQFKKPAAFNIAQSDAVTGYHMERDIDGSIWIIKITPGFYQLSRLNKSGYNQIIHDVDGQIRMFLDNDKLWVGGWGDNEGIWLYHIIRHKDSVTLKLISHYNKLPSNAIRSFCKDKYGNIWAGTRHGGLLQFKPNGNGGFMIRQITRKDGLKGMWIRNISQTTGRLYVATDHGANSLQISENDVSVSDIVEKQSLTDASWDVIQTERDSVIWLATENGALRIQLQPRSKEPIPNVFIIQASCNNITVPISSGNDRATFRPQQNNIRVEFSSTTLRYEKNILYSYRLIRGNTKTEWSPFSQQTSVSFASLPPGFYSFEVRARINNHTESAQLAIWEFTILKHFWQQWWFYISVALLITIATYLIIREIIYHKLEKQRLALGKQKAIETERVRISSELHDDLGGGLSTIRLMSELIQHGDKKDESKQQLEKISSNSKELVQKMNEIVWALNIKNDTLAGLLAYIRQYAVRFLDDNMLECNLSIPKQIPDLSVTGSRRRDIFLLVKESLNNAVKHARATKVDIVFIIDDFLQIKIHDDGVGFDASMLTTTSNGLRNMGKRVDELMGTMTIKNHEGTTVIFDIPLKNLSHESVQ